MYELPLSRRGEWAIKHLEEMIRGTGLSAEATEAAVEEMKEKITANDKVWLQNNPDMAVAAARRKPSNRPGAILLPPTPLDKK